MKVKTATPSRGGFTLIEVAVATILVGLALTAMMISVGSNTRVNDAGTKLTQAAFLAQEIHEWTLTLPFNDLAQLKNDPPLTYCPPRDGQGYAITALPAWSQTITLTWRDSNDPGLTVTPGPTDIIYVNVDVAVDVWHQTTLIVSSGWLVTRKPGE
jgi:prepilin-type N-terminal cleavage/methylation domain-containing protein